RFCQRVTPIHRLQRYVGSRGPYQRALQSVVTLDPVVIEAPDVAHPVAVHVLIEARRDADEPGAFRPFRLRLEPRGRVAALLAERADRVDRIRVVPWSRLEAIVLRRNRAYRADVHQVAREERVHAFFLERTNLAAVTAIRDVDLRVAVDLAH